MSHQPANPEQDPVLRAFMEDNIVTDEDKPQQQEVPRGVFEPTPGSVIPEGMFDQRQHISGGSDGAQMRATPDRVDFTAIAVFIDRISGLRGDIAEMNRPGSPTRSRELSTALTKLDEARQWLRDAIESPS